MWLRTTYDAEPVFHPMTATTDGDTTWWAGELPVHNPVTHYRFLLVRAGATAGRAGVADRRRRSSASTCRTRPTTSSARTPPRPTGAATASSTRCSPTASRAPPRPTSDPTPEWAIPADWDDEVLFEGDDPRTPLQLFGGDLDGITEHLDHVEEVGADIVYTTPVFPGESNHRYNATTFDRVDPLLGGDEAYERLSTAVHARGWRILGDLTTNHTGDTHEWFTRRLPTRTAPTRSYYYFEPDGTYATWMGHTTLPKINHGDPDLRAAMVEGPDSVVGRWLRPPYDVDGWRIDVANMTGRLGALDVAHDVARAARHTAAELRDDPLVIGEHNHDATGDIDGDGWHGTMNYSGFSWPLWSWLRDPASPARAFGRPVPVPRRPGGAVVADVPRLARGLRLAGHLPVLEHPRLARLRPDPHPGRARPRCTGWRPGCSSRCRACRWSSPATRSASRASTARTRAAPMPWHRRDEWDTATLATYSDLARLRRSYGALRHGGLRWAHVDDDTIAFVRELADQRLLVVARRAAGDAFALPTARPRDAPARDRAGGADLDRGDAGSSCPPPTAPAGRLAPRRLTTSPAAGRSRLPSMALRIVASRPDPAIITLPWSTPLEEWTDEYVVPLPRGLSPSRRPHRAPRDRTYAVKETQEPIAFREYRLLRDLQRDGAARGRRRRAWSPAGSTTHGEELPAALMTEHLRFSLPYRSLFSHGMTADNLPSLIDAIVVLLVRLHLAGFYWGDVSLSNVLFRRSAGDFAAYLVDAETGELHDDGERPDARARPHHRHREHLRRADGPPGERHGRARSSTTSPSSPAARAVRQRSGPSSPARRSSPPTRCGASRAGSSGSTTWASTSTSSTSSPTSTATGCASSPRSSSSGTTAASCSPSPA